MPANLAPSCRVGRGPSARWTTTATDMTTSRPLGLDGLTDPVRSMVSPALQRSEEVLESATAVGCTLVLTDRRLMLVRRLVVDARERIYSEEAPADPS